MPFATIIFSSWNWLWVSAGVLAVGLALLFWNYRASPRGPIRWICLALKALGLVALALCLLEPLWSGQRPRPGSNLFAVIADNSQGMQIKDRGAARTRGDILRDLLDPHRAPWQTSLADNFEVRRYYFDTRLQTTKDFSEVAFDGRASGIGAALRTIAERYHGRPLAGILLLTDGNATDLREAPDVPGLPPVYPVIIGSQDPVKDVSIRQVHATQTDFEDAPVTVQADVTAAGYRGASITAQLLDVSGKVVAEQTVRARQDEETLPFRFSLKPEKPGLSFYKFMVQTKPELAAAPGETVEATLANNSEVLVVNRGRGPFHVLIISGRPNWEFKFFNRALQEDPQVRVISLVRVANREPKFNFLGRAGETSNPLFRGFGNQSAEDIQRYDQPVLVRLYPDEEIKNRYEPALLNGFPRTPEALYDYHAVVLDHVEAEFFAPEQAMVLQRFVSERGGGMLMLGGMEAFQHGKYQRTPIGDMLPVYLDRTESLTVSGGLRLNLTPEGWLQPWARLRDNEQDEKARLLSMGPFEELNPVREVKPGASVIATVTDEAGTVFPAFVVQRFGRGRTAAVTVPNLWRRWGFRDADAHSDMDKWWRQLTRWLVNDAPNRVELAAEPQATDPNGAVRLQVQVRDPKFQPLDNASVRLEIQPVMADAGAITNSITLQAEPSGSEPGVYSATYVPRSTGGYRASVSVTNAEGAEVGTAVAGWSTDMAAEEFHSLTPNAALLESIARKTGGQVVSADDLDDFARGLMHRKAPVMEAWTYPLWHKPAVFAFALACFAAEWGLRRWKGMP